MTETQFRYDLNKLYRQTSIPIFTDNNSLHWNMYLRKYIFYSQSTFLIEEMKSSMVNMKIDIESQTSPPKEDETSGYIFLFAVGKHSTK